MRVIGGAHRDGEDPVEGGNLDVEHRAAAVRVPARGPSVQDGEPRAPAHEVDPDAERTLMEVRTAVGRTRRKAHHRDHGHPTVHDHPHVRNALRGELDERGVRLQPFLHHGDVGLAAECVESRDDPRGVIVEGLGPQRPPTGAHQLPVRATGDDDDAVAEGAMHRLEHEGVAVGQRREQVPDLKVVPGDGEERGHRNARRLAEPLRRELVVDEWIEVARIPA
jgi:hypothetical protein